MPVAHHAIVTTVEKSKSWRIGLGYVGLNRGPELSFIPNQTSRLAVQTALPGDPGVDVRDGSLKALRMQRETSLQRGVVRVSTEWRVAERHARCGHPKSLTKLKVTKLNSLAA